MNNSSNKISNNVFVLMCFVLLCSFFTSKNAFSRSNWNRNFTQVTYDESDNAILIRFELIDYHFGPANENGYLKWCDFYFTTDGTNYTKLMKAEVPDQNRDSWTRFVLKDKNIGTRLQLLKCYNPENGSLWPDNSDDIEVHVRHELIKTPNFYNWDIKGYCTIKWYLGDTYNDVTSIRLNGFWKVNGVYKGDNISNVDYTVTIGNSYRSPVKKAGKNQEEITDKNQEEVTDKNQEEVTDKNQEEVTDKNHAKVTSKGDEIVITGAALNEKIKVYDFGGKEVKSDVVNSDVVNIKLPKNQIYYVKIGKGSYKIAL